MSVLKKRTCSFKPTSSVKVMLAEIEALITALDYPLNLEEIINAALQKYLPPVIISLREALSKRKNEIALKAIKEAEKIFQKDITEDNLFNLELNLNTLQSKNTKDNLYDKSKENIQEDNFTYDEENHNEEDEYEDVYENEDEDKIEDNFVDPSIFDRFV